MNTYRNQLAGVLVRTDQAQAEAKSHVDEPDHEVRVRAAKVLVEMVELREDVEEKLRQQ
jgi:hypothetical protein